MPRAKNPDRPTRQRISTTISEQAHRYLLRLATEAKDVPGRVLDTILREHEKAASVARL